MRRLGLITCITCLLAGIVPSLAGADMLATTDDNRRVILNPDGTWALLNPLGEDNDVNVITFGVVGLEPLEAVRPTCAVLSRFDNDSGLTIGTATIELLFFDPTGNIIATEVEWIGNLPTGHATREQRLLVDLHCQNFASVSMNVRQCLFVPPGDCSDVFRPREDSAIPVNF